MPKPFATVRLNPSAAYWAGVTPVDTVIGWVTVFVPPELSVTVNPTVYVPASA